jgi:multidrug efflux system membrane fusion protein
VQLGINKDATVIPNAAIQRGSQGTFVYQVKADQTIAVKPVKVTVVEGELSAIEGDVASGDLLVTDGADKLREGAKVELAKHNDQKKSGNKQAGAAADAAASPQAGVKHRDHKRSSAP